MGLAGSLADRARAPVSRAAAGLAFLHTALCYTATRRHSTFRAKYLGSLRRQFLAAAQVSRPVTSAVPLRLCPVLFALGHHAALFNINVARRHYDYVNGQMQLGNESTRKRQPPGKCNHRKIQLKRGHSVHLKDGCSETTTANPLSCWYFHRFRANGSQQLHPRPFS